MKSDMAFVHAPSIYDFRQRNLKEGPISDVVPSTPLFEMYPVGFVSMLNHIMNNGYTGRICNLAVHMLANPEFDVEKYIRNIDAELFGIDLHWMPHVHGSLNVARIIKKYHPNSKIVMGGFSASYFAEEILKKIDAVDYILLGDFMEGPLVQLLDSLESHKNVEEVNSLAYRDNGKIRMNSRSGDTDPASSVFIDYSILLKTAIKYHDIRGHLPYLSWITNPVGMTLI